MKLRSATSEFAGFVISFSEGKGIGFWEWEVCAYGNKGCRQSLITIFEKFSGKIAEIYDVKPSGEITDVYEELVSSVVKVIGERNESEGRYWDLVKKLAKCERERDEERCAREQAEYDKEYFVKQIAEGR